MLCNEFRDLIFERMSGELTPQQDSACSEHERTCAICRAELAQFRSITVKMRAAWPAEEPMPIHVALPQATSRSWFDVSALWFSRASAGLVAASLLFLVLVRPSVQVGHGNVQMTFGAPVAQAQTMTEAQVKAMVQAAVQAQTAQTQALPVSAKPASQTPDVTQVAMQVRQMQRNEATLWQTVQQHSMYLDTLWKQTSENPVRPASFTR